MFAYIYMICCVKKMLVGFSNSGSGLANYKLSFDTDFEILGRLWGAT